MLQEQMLHNIDTSTQLIKLNSMVKGLKFESIIGKIRNHTHRATTSTTQHSPITNLLAKS